MWGIVAVRGDGSVDMTTDAGSTLTMNADDEIIAETSGGATITMLANGKIELNGNAKNSMTFEDFETVWNNFITHYKLHTHSNGQSGSPTGTIIAPTTPAEEDMTAAKNEQVKL